MEKYFDINEQGFSIRCKMYAKDIHKIQRVVIFGHGFGGHKDNHAAARFAQQTTSKYKDVGVLTFDWPCHGQDARNKLVLADCITYLDLVIDYVKKTYTEEEIYYYGTSFGGYLVLKYISENGSPFRKIALRCPAVEMSNVLSGIMTDDDRHKIERGKDALIGFDRKVKVNKTYLEDVKSSDITKLDFLDFADDILIFHGTEDEVVPFESVRRFAEENVIEFVPVEGTDHRFRNQKLMDQVHQDILKFFEL